MLLSWRVAWLVYGHVAIQDKAGGADVKLNMAANYGNARLFPAISPSDQGNMPP
jgi:hypothetical protein